MFVLDPASEGRDSSLSRLDGSVRFKVLVDEDKSSPSKVPLIVWEVEEAGVVEWRVGFLQNNKSEPNTLD